MNWPVGIAVAPLLLLFLAVVSGCAGQAPMQEGRVSDFHARLGQHPVLFFTADDLPRLRASTKTSHRKQFERLLAWGKLFKDFDPIAADKLPNDRDVMQVYYENGANYVFNMSLLYQLTLDETYYDKAHQWLAAFASYPVETDGGYFIGAYTLALASGYDMLYPRLSAAERESIRDHLAAVLQRGKTGTETDWWAKLRLHHDHWVPAAGLCVGALALLDGSPEAAARLDFFEKHLQHAMDAVGNDGSWTEGVAQWNYALAMLEIYEDAEKHVTGRNRFHEPLMKNTVAYRLYQWLPPDQYIYHHDSFPSGRYNIMGSASTHVLHKLAAENKNSLAQWLADQDDPADFKNLDSMRPIKPSWLTSREIIVPDHHAVGWDFLWFDPTVKPVKPDAALPNYVYFPNQGLVVARSGWSPDDTVFTFTCAPVGGHKGRDEVLAGDTRIASNIGHIHALAGAFNIWAKGNFLAAAAGYGMRASSNENTLTIEGADQFLDPRYNATIAHLAIGKDYAYIAGDATDCYPAEANLKRWVRHVVWLSPDLFVIADELQARAAASSGRDTVWRLDYIPEKLEAHIDAKQSAFRIVPKSRQGGALAVQFVSPSGMNLDDAAVRHEWNELPTSVVGGLRLNDQIVKSKDGWIAFGQARATASDIFKSSTRREIVSVLSVLPSSDAPSPAARAIVSNAAIGAVVDDEHRTRVAVIRIGDLKPAEPLKISFEANAAHRPECMLFNLPPNSAWNISRKVRQQGGLSLVELELTSGTQARAGADGVLRFDAPLK